MQATAKAAKQVGDLRDWLALTPVAALCLAMAGQPGCATTALWPDQQGDSRHGQRRHTSRHWSRTATSALL